MQLTVVIPTYNEAENLPRLVSVLFSLPLPDLRILIVDDNSPDGTGEIANRLGNENLGRLTVLRRSGKLGLGSAYVMGFGKAIAEGAEAVAQMDADFSHPPEKLVEMLEVLENCDVAMGSRYVPGGSVDKQWPLWRKGLSAFGNIYAARNFKITCERCYRGISNLASSCSGRDASGAGPIEWLCLSSRDGVYRLQAGFYL